MNNFVEAKQNIDDTLKSNGGILSPPKASMLKSAIQSANSTQKIRFDEPDVMRNTVDVNRYSW